MRDKKPVKRQTIQTDRRIIQSDSAEYRQQKLKAVERRKARSRSISMVFFTLLIMLLTVILIMNVMKTGAPKPQFMFIPQGSIEHTITSTALIIRNENVIKAPVDGVVKPVIQEGSRVSFGETVAIILDNKSDETLSALRNSRQQIAELQIDLMNQGKGPGAKVIYDEADREISQLIDLLRRDSMQGKTSTIDAYKTSIVVIMERRDIKLLSVDFNDSRLNELKQQKSSLERELGIVAGTLTAKLPGMVSYYIDGLEEILTFESVNEMTIEKYKNFIKNSDIRHVAGTRTDVNNPVLRITSGIFQYIVVMIPQQFKAQFQQDTFHELFAPMMGTKIPGCRVVNIIEENGEMAVVFRTERQLERFSDTRFFETQIVIKTTTGMRVPFTSIFDFNEMDMSGNVFLVGGGYIRKAPVKIVDFNREYAIIESVEDSEYKPQINGYLVKNPESVKEGDGIGGTR